MRANLVFALAAVRALGVSAGDGDDSLRVFGDVRWNMSAAEVQKLYPSSRIEQTGDLVAVTNITVYGQPYETVFLFQEGQLNVVMMGSAVGTAGGKVECNKDLKALRLLFKPRGMREVEAPRSCFKLLRGITILSVCCDATLPAVPPLSVGAPISILYQRADKPFDLEKHDR